MKIDVLTIFPAMFEGPLTESIIGRARDLGLIDVEIHDIRDFTVDKHRTVDDTPYGGGAGMVMMPDPLFNAIESVTNHDEKDSTADNDYAGESDDYGCFKSKSGRRFACPVIFMTPQGSKLDQSTVKDFSRYDHLVILAGHYEGIDERVRYDLITHEISIGDYVLTGGELPAMVLIDAVSRMIPGVIKEQESYEKDSFYNGLLEHPHYTRPGEYRGMKVPEVLMNGHHEKIDIWRRKESLKRTLERRPELLEKVELSDTDRMLLDEIRKES